MRVADRWRRVLPVFGAIAAGWVLHFRSLSAGFILDDYYEIAALEHRLPVPRAFWDLYSFDRSSDDVDRLVRAGSLPWWSDRGMLLCFFRPLASATLALDHWLFGYHARLWHIHSLLWWTAMVCAAAWVLSREFTHRAASLAVFAFALDEAHAVPVTWLANRHSLVAATFVLFSVGFLRRGRALPSWISFALALAAGEYAWSGLGFLFALIGLDRSHSWRARVGTLAPYLLLAGTYAAIRHALGYGVRFFVLYVDPFRDPREAPAWLFHQFGRLLADLAIGVPESATWHPWMWLASLSALIVLWCLAREAEAWLLGSLLALIPVGFALAMARQLVLPSVGVAAVVGVAMDRMLSCAHRPKLPGVAVRLAVLLPIAGLHLGWAPYLVFVAERAMDQGGRTVRREAMAAPLSPAATPYDVVLLGVGDVFTMWHFAEMRRIGGRPLPGAAWVIGTGWQSAMFRRLAVDTFEIRFHRLDGVLASEATTIFRRRDRPLIVGETVHAGRMDITILASGPLGPTWIRVRFDRSLDDASLRFLLATPQGLRPFEMPPLSFATWLPPYTDASTLP